MKMATSSFGKQFTLPRNKADEFVKNMTEAVTPTLRLDFETKFTYLSQNKELKNCLDKVLINHLPFM